MPQFSLSQLLVSMALISVGCGIFTWLFQATPEENSGPLALTFSGFVLVGAAIGNLFKNPILGGFLGILAMIVVGVLCFVFFIFSYLHL
jgi:hypothetical protein